MYLALSTLVIFIFSNVQIITFPFIPFARDQFLCFGLFPILVIAKTQFQNAFFNKFDIFFIFFRYHFFLLQMQVQQ